MLPKSKLNNIEVLIFKALIDSNISHDEFVLIYNVLKEFYDMKEKTLNNDKINVKQCCFIDQSKKLIFIKKQEFSGLLTSLGIKTPLNDSIIRFYS